MSKSRLWMLTIASIAILTALIFAQEQKKPLSPPGTATLSFADGKTVTIN